MSTTFDHSTPPGVSGASQRAIANHYDVGNEFYGLWLDPTLSYSCALWEGSDDLERAQRRKLEYHAREARAAGQARVLDIGCGWGGLLEHLSTRLGVKEAIGLTLSDEQARFVRERGPEGSEVRLESWQQHEPEKPYDAIVSIGAFEHFARPNLSHSEKIAGYRAFFERCRGWLVPGRWMSLQTIAYAHDRELSRSAFIESEVFLESELPSLAEIAEARSGSFDITTVRNDRDHYERTCKAWLRNLKRRRGEALALVGSEGVERFEKYLALAAIGFHIGHVDLLRITLRRVDRRGR